MLFSKIHAQLGGKFFGCIAGGAPLDANVAKFFERIGIRVYQGYGLSETSPVVSVNYDKPGNFASVGHPLDHFEYKIDPSNGELLLRGPSVNLLQQTMAGFTRNASRRMDAELCIINLCQPELKLDCEAINARLTRLEEQAVTGQIVVTTPNKQQQAVVTKQIEEDDDRAPMPDDHDAPPEQPQQVFETPAGFWPDLAASVRKELKPPVSGFFAPTPNAPLRAVLSEDSVILECANSFTMEVVNKPEILSLVARKASAMLGRQMMARAVDITSKPRNSAQMERLLNFGRAHQDIIHIKE